MTASARDREGAADGGGHCGGHGAEAARRRRAAAATLFEGAGEVRALARMLDWGTTPLGWPDAWSPALRIATRAMLDQLHPICLWSGPDLALVYNDAYRRILGAKHPAALGQPGAAVWAESWAPVEAQFAQVWHGGPPVYHEDARFVMARLEGGATEDGWFSYSLSALRDEDGTIVALLNIAPETTARVRAEQALATERERLRNVILQAPVPMALHEGPEHRYALVNAAYRRVCGGRDVTGLSIREAFPEMAGQGVWEVFDRVYTTGTPWLGPETPVHYDRLGTGVAEDAWFDLHYDPVRDADVDVGGVLGPVTGILNFSVDVTDQVRARREVERLLAESERARQDAEASRWDAEQASAAAAAANNAKTQFLSAMSHELRTPLNAVAGYADLLLLGLRGPLADAQRADVERLRRANRHMAGLVDAVLNFARVEARGVEYHLEAVPLGPLVADLEVLVAPQLAAKGLAYGHDACGPETPDQPHVVRADPEKVRQILLNLLANAVKFTDAGGRVALACETDRAARVIHVRVMDTGRGIAAEHLEHVFEPFVQVERHRTPDGQQGVGLGLAISRDLARGMGGELTAESTPGVGATFTLTLPAAAPGAR